MKELFFALRGEDPKTFETAYMAFDGTLFYESYNELRERKQLHYIDFKCYCYGDEAHPSEISSQINELCFKAKMKHPKLNFYPQFFEGGREKVDKDLDTELRELGMVEIVDGNAYYINVESSNSTWEDDIKLPCSFDKVCKNLVPM